MEHVTRRQADFCARSAGSSPWTVDRDRSGRIELPLLSFVETECCPPANALRFGRGTCNILVLLKWSNAMEVQDAET